MRKNAKVSMLPTVAPCMGAWIETLYDKLIELTNKVAPCMGAWIETDGWYIFFYTCASHPVWVRGLKLAAA